MNKYSILIPIHNEISSINILLEFLIPYSINGHEVIIIDDGSTDGSQDILSTCKMIKLITLRKNKGKGFAIKAGLQKVKYDMVIIFDGDLELHPLEISKLMILDKKNNIHSALGYRFKKLNPLKSNFAWGNFIFTTFFNIIFNTNHKDILCCAKALYLNDIKNYKIISNGFDIDVELSFLVSIINKKRVIPQVKLDYKRRSIEEGKKLKISDGWGILLRIIKMMKFL